MSQPEGRPPLLGDDGWTGDPSTDPLYSDLVTEGAPSDSAQAPEPAASEPPAPEAGQQPEGEEPATEGDDSQPQPEPLLAGRFKSVQDLEQGWRESDAFARRSAARANQAEARARAAQAELEAMRKLAAERATPEPPRPPIDTQALEQLGLDPSAGAFLQNLIDQEVRRRLTPVEQRIANERQEALATQAATREEAARQAAIDQFRGAHADLQASHEDEMVALLDDMGVLAIDQRTGQRLGPTTADWYEIAYEAVRDPDLARVLRATPELGETDDGMELARFHAAQLKARAQMAAGAQRTAPPAPAPPNPAADVHTLTGPANTPAGGPQTRQLDPIDEIVEADKADRRSVFTGGAF